MASNKLEVTLAALNKGQDYAILTGKSPIYSYDNGKERAILPLASRLVLPYKATASPPYLLRLKGKLTLYPKSAKKKLKQAVRI